MQTAAIEFEQPLRGGSLRRRVGFGLNARPWHPAGRRRFTTSAEPQSRQTVSPQAGAPRPTAPPRPVPPARCRCRHRQIFAPSPCRSRFARRANCPPMQHVPP